jgi:hypothetical protein
VNANTFLPHPSRPLLERPRAGWSADLITIALGLWLIAGVFIDGYAHNFLRGTMESFFSPWHAILYSGFMAAAAWTTWLVAREVRRGHSGWNAIPIGYELGLLGVLIFGAGGIGDLIWHELFGIEADVAALLSPTHLFLLTGGTLVVTSPLRSGWATLGRKPRFWAFLPTLLSGFAALSFVSFFNLYGWGLTGVPDSNHYMDFLKQHGDELMFNYALRLAAMGSLFTNVVLMTLVLLLVRRWRIPFGTFMLIFALNTCCMSAINGLVEWFGVLASAVSGWFADAFIARFDPSPIRVLELRWLSALLPLVIWGSHYTVRLLTGGLPLEPEIWSGVTVMTALTGLVLGVLVVPPRIPEALEAGHESH